MMLEVCPGISVEKVMVLFMKKKYNIRCWLVLGKKIGCYIIEQFHNDWVGSYNNNNTVNNI